ncbi:MAG: HEAT repeat domain-containing protein [Planctomycetes bacterium]|nr:HEAT repeat domain-containing protein [Planctomycetota bacterium]
MDAPATRLQRLAPWLECAVIVAAALWTFAGLANALDLHAADEAGYLERGRRLLSGDVAADLFAWAPTTCLSLGVADALWPARLAPDVVQPAWIAAQAAGLWWLARSALPRGLAVAAALVWLASDAVIGDGRSMQPSPYAVSTALLFWGLGCIVRTGSRWRSAAGLLLLGLAMLDRAELAVPAGACALGLVALDLRRRRLGLVSTGLALLVAAALAATFLSPPHRARSWLTFEQHYAGRTAAREAARDGGDDRAELLAALGASRDYRAILARDFPGATSLSQAIASSPSHYASYAWSNALELPRMFRGLAGSHWSWTPLPAAGTGLGALLLVALTLLVPARRRALAGALAALPPATRVAIGSGLATVVTAVLLAPRVQVLFAALPALATGVGLALVAWLPARARAPVGWTLAALVLGGLLAGPRRYPDAPRDGMPLRRAVDLAIRRVPADARRLLGIDSNEVGRYARLPQLAGTGPALDEIVVAESAARWWPRGAPPDAVLVPLDLLEAAPGYTVDLLVRAQSAPLRIADVAPMWLLFTRPTDADPPSRRGAPRSVVTAPAPEAITAPEPRRAGAAILAAGLLAEPAAVAPLLAATRAVPPLAARAAWALGECGAAAAVPRLLELTGADDALTRACACFALTKCARRDAEVVAHTRRLLDDADPLVRRVATDALERHGSQPPTPTETPRDR